MTISIQFDDILPKLPAEEQRIMMERFRYRLLKYLDSIHGVETDDGNRIIAEPTGVEINKTDGQNGIFYTLDIRMKASIGIESTIQFFQHSYLTGYIEGFTQGSKSGE